MARSRNIKPGFFKNEDLAELGPYAQLLFAGLWTLADKEGRLEDRPRRIKAEIFPYYDCEIDSLLTALHEACFIQRYAKHGLSMIQVQNWRKHQRPHHKEQESDFPAPDEEKKTNKTKSNACTNQAQAKHEPSTSQAQAKQIAPCPTDTLNLIPDTLNSDTLNLIPDTLNSDTLNLIPDTLGYDEAMPSPSTTKKQSEPKTTKTIHVWKSYSEAYHNRYGVDPVRNAKVNGQLGRLIDRIGKDDAPHVAAFFVGHNNSYYVQRGHSVDCLLADCEKLRTEWATNRKVTQTQARQLDKSQSNADVFNKLIDDAVREEQRGGKINNG